LQITITQEQKISITIAIIPKYVINYTQLQLVVIDPTLATM